MKQAINSYEFCNAFKTWDTYKDNFSYNGLTALFDYLEQLEEDTDTEIELDVVALCCEYTEYASAYEAMQEYKGEDMPVEGGEGNDILEIQARKEKAAREWLEYRTTVIDVQGGGVIIQDF